jgi:5'-deoxynucleotidase YfbR-like HD superfamily hydrolase
MMVIAFADDFKELDIEKCLKLALIHDIVEIYS